MLSARLRPGASGTLHIKPHHSATIHLCALPPPARAHGRAIDPDSGTTGRRSACGFCLADACGGPYVLNFATNSSIAAVAARVSSIAFA